MKNLSKLLDKFSNFFAHRKGLLIMAGLLFVAINFLIVIFSDGWLSRTGFFLHFGIILAFIGILLSWAL